MDDSIYLDIDLYNYYSIIYKNNQIICVTDNILDCNYVVENNDIDFFYNIEIDTFENSKIRSLIKNKNNDNFQKIKQNSIEISKIIYYIVVNLDNRPLKISTRLAEIINFSKIYEFGDLYIVGVKLNKIYSGYYAYEYFLKINK